MIGQDGKAAPRSDPQIGPEISARAPVGPKRTPSRLELRAFANTISSHLGGVLTAPTPGQPKQFPTNTYLRSEPMKIRPLHDRVIVKRLESETKTAGGIVIPDSAAEKPVQGKIVAVGKGKILEDGTVRPLDVKIGDKILFGKYSGTEVKVDGDDLLVMREEDVMAVIEGK